MINRSKEEEQMKDVLKIVIDEEFDNGEIRILLSRRKKLKSTSKDWTNYKIWDTEEEKTVTGNELKDMLGWRTMGTNPEGRVFLKSDKGTIEITKDMRKKAKESFKQLTQREGK